LTRRGSFFSKKTHTSTAIVDKIDHTFVVYDFINICSLHTFNPFSSIHLLIRSGCTLFFQETKLHIIFVEYRMRVRQSSYACIQVFTLTFLLYFRYYYTR
jgi:hypothetical protein